jgi:GTP-binding protein
MKLIDASFLKSAQSLKDSPDQNIVEIAFLGRSNVGKSTLLNTLTNRKNLAKSSSTPGKTQLINFFNITYKKIDDLNDNLNKNKKSELLYARFVDLPGFGYAKVSKSLKEQWNKNLTSYLINRFNLRIYIHLIDSRHINLKIDNEVEEFLNQIQKKDQKIIKVFTKIDKLKKNDLRKLKNIYKNGIFISNMKKEGLQNLQDKITNYLFNV